MPMCDWSSDVCSSDLSSAEIPSPPLALFVVMLLKAHLTSHSRMSGSTFLPPHFKGKKVWRRGCEEGVGIRGVQKRNQAGVPAKSPQDREVSPSVPAPRLYRRESVLPPKAPGPLAPPSTSNGKLDSLWPFKGGGGRGGRRTSPRRDRDVRGADLCF